MLQLKGRDFQTGFLKSKIQLYDKNTLNIKTQTKSKKMYYANISHRKARVVILISDKVEFKIKKITRDMRDISRRHKNPEFVCTQLQRFKIYKAKLTEWTEKNRHSWL